MTRPGKRTSNQTDLFGTAPVVPGFAYAEGIVPVEQQPALTAAIDAIDPQPFRFQQWTGKRLTRSYGWSYDFATGAFAPTDPIPEWLLPLRAAAARFAGLDAQRLEQVLLTRYDAGAGIGWHRDRPVFEHVIGVSLGAPATLRFRRRVGEKFERASAHLAPGSAYHLSAEARYGWEHGIAPMDSTRWSITFRTLRERP